MGFLKAIFLYGATCPDDRRFWFLGWIWQRFLEYPSFWSGIKWNGSTAADYKETIEFPDLVFSMEFTVFYQWVRNFQPQFMVMNVHRVTQVQLWQKTWTSALGVNLMDMIIAVLVTIAAAVFLSCTHHNISFTSNLQMGFILFDLLPWMLKSTLVCRCAARPPTYGEAPTLTQPRRIKDQLRCVWHT